MKLKASNLVKSYSGKNVVKQVSVELNQGEIVGLLGPNGAGKTTSFYMIVGLIKANSGKIHLNKKEITDYPMYKRAQNGIGYLAQESSVFRKMSVEDNILSVLELTNLSKKEQIQKTESLLDEFGLLEIRKRRGDLLSGGERRRTEIARALASNPKFLLLDEPFAGIDPIAIEEVKSTISLLKKMNIGIIVTDHNVKEALSIVDFGYIIYNGEIIKSGSPKEITSDKFVKKIYLGKNYT